MRIRPAVAVDVPSILTIELAHPSAAHWSEEQYLELLQSGSEGPERLILVAESSPKSTAKEATFSIDAFLVARHVANEWELENIVVALGAQRRGLGRELLQTLFTTAHKTDSASVFLEVRESNKAARSLYEKSGFRQMGRRSGYYVNPTEDAILYRFDLA